jgi:hypothetical protein
MKTIENREPRSESTEARIAPRPVRAGEPVVRDAATHADGKVYLGDAAKVYVGDAAPVFTK